MTEKTDNTKKQKTVSARSLARLGAVLALYQMDIAGTDLNIIIDEFVNSRGPSAVDLDNQDAMQIDLSTMDKVLFKDILHGIVANQSEVDNAIHAKLTKDWPMARVDTTLRAIFRAAGYEMLKRADIPPKVIINEYVELSTAFFDGRETNMINGVLDAIAKDIRAM
ncbi:MAG: transcription antitermination factor NusB [Rhizobiales bacterium]|nr:transcription antitermination factor NusB [Hyphomicrobiales bacterium]NRB12817.1 transcription antitermination factor NusB [Hyphomicrobiales bacterium]